LDNAFGELTASDAPIDLGVANRQRRQPFSELADAW
jgi:hypothetical protein